MHEVLVNRLGGLSLPRKSVVRLTDRPDMTLDVYRGRKTTIQQQQQPIHLILDTKSIIHWNCRGLRANYNEILILMSLFSPNVICLQEIFLKQSDNISFRHFNMFNYISPDGQRASGGTSIMVKSSVPHR